MWGVFDMSFEDIESSNYDAVVTKLYDFRLGDTTNYWRYTSHPEEIIWGGESYIPTTISDAGVTQSGDVDNDDFVITLPADAEFCNLFIGTPPSCEITVVAREKLEGEDETQIIFAGLVRSTKRVSRVATDVICKARTASLNRNGLRLSWSRTCTHVLYDTRCRANPAVFVTEAVTTTVTNLRITSAAFALLPTGRLNNGYVEWDGTNGVTERRGIDRHVNNTIFLIGQTDGLVAGSTVRAYPGCNNTPATCENVFNNLANHGGFAKMPGRSPFDGRPIF